MVGAQKEYKVTKPISCKNICKSLFNGIHNINYRTL